MIVAFVHFGSFGFGDPDNLWGQLVAKQGSSRFGRLLGAARKGEHVAPVDMRYLQKGVPKRGQRDGDSARGQVVSFLRGVYESIAETLPDVRDDAWEDGAELTEGCMSVQLPQLEPDPHSQAMGDPNVDSKLMPKPKARGIQVKRRGLSMNRERRPENGYEKRWLPPGHIKDYYDQFLSSPSGRIYGNGKKIAFSTFWRIWHEEYGMILQFRPTSSHALCSTCCRHKLLIKGFAGHLKARQAQITHYANHLHSQYCDRLCYWDLRAQSRLQGSMGILCIVDAIDQCKFQYPRSDMFRSKELQGLNRPKAHIVGAILHGHSVIFSVSPSDLRKDANSSIELVAYCLQALSRKVNLRRVTFHLQSDNTSREVKNNHMIRFLASLVAHGFMVAIVLKLFLATVSGVAMNQTALKHLKAIDSGS